MREGVASGWWGVQAQISSREGWGGGGGEIGEGRKEVGIIMPVIVMGVIGGAGYGHNTALYCTIVYSSNGDARLF